MRASAIVERVFNDVSEPFGAPCVHGARNEISFIDDFSRYAVVNFIVFKRYALVCLKTFVAEHGARKKL